MGLFDVFKKKECCICGNEVGLLGNRKLEDGNMCSKCTKKLSPWFEDRRHSTVADIKAQLAYREQNQQELESFTVSRVLGDFYRMYIEEVNDVPTRFFVTDSREYMEDNPDIISFKDVISCVGDIETHEEEVKERNAEGEMVSCVPPRYKVHHDFFVEMEIRNNPYFDKIRFSINAGVVTLERTGSVGLFGGMVGRPSGGLLGAIGDISEQRRYREYEQMLQKIQQAVEDGKRGAAAAPQVQEEAPAEEPPAPAGPKFCPECGAPADGGKFCQYCGAKLM